MTNLLIVESPAKCSKIQGFLGPGWRVIATMGHIRALEESVDAVGIDRDFEARYAFLKDKSKAIQQIRECAKGATVYLASDDDREGEAISYSVAVLLKLDVATTPRIVFHEITKDAITAALRAPRRIDMNRVNAQQARSILDMMVGFTISPLLWKFVGQGLSAGRCQTPALRLVADKEAEIKDFKVETSWSVKAQWIGKEKGACAFEAALVDALEDEESATNFMENISTETDGRVVRATTRPTTENAPKPLITSTLQQEASALYGSQPKNTMRIAQKLYEAGHITYMRTDHPVLSEEARRAAEGYAKTTYGEAFVSTTAPEQPKTKKKTDAAAAAQEAHEAIRPTHIELTELPENEDWSAPERKVYRLIWNRTIQSVMAPCRGETREVFLVATGDPGEFEWIAVWKRVIFQGWKRVGQALAVLDEEEEEAGAAPAGSWTQSQSLTEGTLVRWMSMIAAPKETKASARYTEATLVRELEKRGIGRPSTFASLIGTILDKEYVEKRDTPARDVLIRSLTIVPNQWPPTVVETPKKVGAEKQKLAPTPLGLSALEFCTREFDKLFAYTFTREMETRLDRISEGAEPWKGICRDTWASYRENYETLKARTGTQTTSARQVVFANGIKAVQSKKGPLLLIEGPDKDDTVFYGWPEGIAFSAITEDIAKAHVDAQKALKEKKVLGTFEGNPITLQGGPYGQYVTCGGSNVPWVAGDTVETIIEKLRAKGQSVLHTLGPFEFRRGQYGVYMFKKDITQRKFVGVPSGVDPKALTVEAAIKIYQTGLQQKAKSATYAAGRQKKT
jgi:DNA topoisomerase-1